MKKLFLLGGMMFISVVTFSQELRVSNQRTAVADPNQKQIAIPESNQKVTLVTEPVERAMNALDIEESLGKQEKNEMINTVNSSPGSVMEGQKERTLNSNQSKANTVGKPL